VLLRLGRDAPGSENMERAAAQAGVPLEVIALDLPEVSDLYQRRLVLVRPDGHVAWRADEPPADARAVIDIVRGAPECATLATPADAEAAGSAIHTVRGGRP
jgi:hypothetical protein